MFYKVASHKAFDYAITIAIFLSTVLMCVQWYNQPELVDIVTNDINIAFVLIFVVECIIKIIAYDKTYFKEGWNIFDLIITIASALSAAISLFDGAI